MAKKTDYQADAAYLRKNVPYYAKHSTPKDAAYTHRIAENIRAQKSAGLPINLPAARGHLVTPEHPDRRRPRLPEGTTVSKYRGGKQPSSKYLRKTVPLEKPIVHKRPINPPERLNLSDGAVVDVYFDAGPTVQRLIELGSDWRVVLAGFDCTLGIWREIGVNRGHGRGWTADGEEGALIPEFERWQKQHKDNKDFEDWFISIANSTASDPAQDAERMTHVCMWRVYAYPVNAHLRRRAFATAR